MAESPVTRPEPFDVRLPLGALFSIVGGVLLAFGIATRDDAEIYIPSGALNVNRDWGAVMLVTGVLLLGLAWGRRRRGGSRAQGVPLQ